MIKTDFFLVFLFAHFVGDFVLQTDKIAAMKATKVSGIAVHVSILTAVQCVLLSVYGLYGVAAGLAVGIAHFFIDYAKLKLNRFIGRMQFLYFIFDQMVHILVLAAAAYVFSPAYSIPEEWMGYIKLAIILITLLFITTVAVKIMLRDMFKHIMKMAFFMKHERVLDAVSAVLVWIFWYLPWLPGIFAIAAALLPYGWINRKMFNYNTEEIIYKYVFLSFAGFMCNLVAFM